LVVAAFRLLVVDPACCAAKKNTPGHRKEFAIILHCDKNQSIIIHNMIDINSFYIIIIIIPSGHNNGDPDLFALQ